MTLLTELNCPARSRRGHILVESGPCGSSRADLFGGYHGARSRTVTLVLCPFTGLCLLSAPQGGCCLVVFRVTPIGLSVREGCCLFPNDAYHGTGPGSRTRPPEAPRSDSSRGAMLFTRAVSGGEEGQGRIRGSHGILVIGATVADADLRVSIVKLILAPVEY